MNIVLVSHGALCEGVNDAYHMLVPGAGNVRTVSLTDAGVESFRARLKGTLDGLLADGDVLIMADLEGGTPYNESLMGLLQDPDHIRLVAGLNLPMLVEAGLESLAGGDLESVYRTALAAGDKGVKGAELPEEGPDDDADLF